MAGHHQGFNDERGTIVHHVPYLIENKLPNRFLLENVKGFTTLDNGKYVKQATTFLKGAQDVNSQQAYWSQ